MAEASLTHHRNTTAALRRVPLFAIFALCALWGLWLAQQSVLLSIVTGRAVQSWPRTLGLALSPAIFWAVMAPLVMITTRLIRDRVRARALWLVAHIATFLVVHVLDVAVYSMISAVLAPSPQPFIHLLFSLTTFNTFAYVMVAALTTALDYQDALRERSVRAAQLEAQLALAQFQALRAQLHPHFLFNALNAISALIHKDAARADRMLARLSELLRLAIDSAATPEVRLIDEVHFVERYLDIERMRFGDRLDVRIDLPAETYNALVPNMLLQPLVENAVRHGVAPHPERGRVELHAVRHGSQLGIVVSDTGRGIATAAPNELRVGVGLRTTRERLAKLYGTSHELALVNIPGGGFETRVTIPFRRRDDATDQDSLSRR